LLPTAPRGNTALLDAIGQTLNTVGARLSKTPEAERPGKVIVVILTDGMENASKEFSAARVKEMITEQHGKYSWEFVYLGANQDAFKVGNSYGIANSIGYAGTHKGTSQSYATVSSLLGSYRQSGKVVVPDSSSDEKN